MDNKEKLNFDDLYICSWDVFYLKMCYLIARKSKDKSSKIGSILIKEDKSIISAGFNGLPIGCLEKEKKNERPEKYYHWEHSERSAIYLAARNGIQTKDSLLVTISVPCTDCCRAIIQSGVKMVLYHKQHKDIFYAENEKWAESCKRSEAMLKEAGVRLEYVNKELGEKTLINGKIFDV
jgi:dCMP deaminase